MARAPERSNAVTCRAPGGVSRGGPPQVSRGFLAAGGVCRVCVVFLPCRCTGTALVCRGWAGAEAAPTPTKSRFTPVGQRVPYFVYFTHCLNRTHRSIKYTSAHAALSADAVRGRRARAPTPPPPPAATSRAVGKLLAGRHRARGHAFPQRQTRNEPRRRGSPTRTGSQRCKGSMRTPAARRWRPARRAEVSREARARGFDLMR